MTVHVVYPHGDSMSYPDAIGRHLGRELRSWFDVRQYDWTDRSTIDPQPGDSLIGHPHPAPGTIFRNSMKKAGWERVIAMIPYAHGEITQMAWADRIIQHCDLFLAITGNYWFRRVAESKFAHWMPKMIHLDLAIERSEFPIVKRTFNPRGESRFVYIGHSVWPKNTQYLSQIAKLVPQTEMAWMGIGREPIEGLKPLGFQDFKSTESRRLLGSFDFMITVGHSDANPATILESMSWGLVPVCTPQSGYERMPGIMNIPLGRPLEAASILQNLQTLAERDLLEMQAANWDLLDSHFNWSRFGRQVRDAIQSGNSPSLGPEALWIKGQLLGATVASPYFWLRPRQLVHRRRAKRASLQGR